MPRTIGPMLLTVLLTGTVVGVQAQTPSNAPTAPQKEARMHYRATGTFDVKVAPITTVDSVDTGGFDRVALDKHFHGDLTATSLGQMLASGGPNDGSGAYVALEKITGTLKGKTGTFVMMHNGTMTPTSMEMRISVVPGSGTGELEGIEGHFTLTIEGKTHSWVLDYTLPQ